MPVTSLAGAGSIAGAASFVLTREGEDDLTR